MAIYLIDVSGHGVPAERVETADIQSMVARLLGSPVSLATVGPILNVAKFESVAEKFRLPASRAAVD